MKNILMAACCAVVMFAANNAKAFCENTVCAASINGDSGITLRNCTDTGVAGNACECTEASTGAESVKITTGPCGRYWALESYMFDGAKCCGWVGWKSPTEEDFAGGINAEARTEVQERLSQVYDANFDGTRTTAYFGYADANLRSPGAGRTTAAKAKLDACLYYTDVDALTGADNAEKWGNCVGSTVGCGASGKNEHCFATGMNDGSSVTAAVCKDRCDCVFGQGTCAGL